MNRSLTALFSALEALLVVGIGIGVPLAPLTVLWAFQYGLQIDWVIFWRTAVDIWLLGSGVDVTMTLNPVLASGLGFDGAGKPFPLTIALLGFSLLTVLLGARAGRRIGEIPFRLTGILASLGTFAVLSFVVTLSALWSTARASIWQGTLLPTVIFAIGLFIGLGWARRPGSSRGEERVPERMMFADLPQRALVSTVLRGGAGAAAMVLAVSAVITAVLFLGHYAKIISLYESIHAGVLGGVAITIGQLALLPNLIVWCASWLIGPGFALGSGSAISPLGTTLGPIPAIPVLGALPESTGDWAFLGLLVPVLAGFVAALAVRPTLVETMPGRRSIPRVILAGLLIGVVAGILLGAISWASAGAAGPGRLVDVGPSPLLIGAWASVEVAIAATIGMLVGAPRTSNSTGLSVAGRRD
ncbi:DUF6350 family protein [soil metagenome]